MVVYTDLLTEPNLGRRNHQSQFTALCIKTPSVLFMDLKNIFVAPCRMPTKENMILTTRLRNAYHLIEMRIDDKQSLLDFCDYHLLKEAILLSVGNVESKKIDEIIGRLEKVTASSTEELEKQMKEFGLKKSSLIGYTAMDSCPMKMIAQLSNHSRSAIFQEINKLRKNLVHFAGVTCACANITFDGNKDMMDDFLETTERKLVEVSDFVANWTTTSLELTWPEAMLELCKHSLPPKINNTKYHQYARMIQAVANSTGPSEYNYQIVIVPLDSYLETSIIASNPDNYANFSTKDFVCHIFRFRRGKEILERARSLDEYFLKNNDDLKDFARSKIRSDINESFPEMNTVFKLTGPGRWTTGIQLRSRTIFCSSSYLDTCGLSGKMESSSNRRNQIDVKENTGHCWKTRILPFV